MGGIKRKAVELEVPITNPTDVMKITPLGAGNEVGRSCILIEYKGKKIMLDCGIHPAYTGLSALPFFDEIDPSEIDILLITHFHLDHAASLPYFLEKTTFKGRVFMTHPTKAIYKWLISDYTRVSNVVVEDILYDDQDLLKSCEKVETIDYHQEMEIEGIKFTAYNAGHVLGAAMFLIEIAGIKLLYTGDYSTEEDRHLMAAEKPSNVFTDVMICESTYGVQSLEPRLEREARFTKTVKDIVQRGGRCLIPVFALGRAQEILLILDEYWQENLELHSVPIYYASALAKKCMAIYQTYINMMNTKIRKQYKISNPFIFKHISNLKSMEHFDDVGPCVMIASPGTLQSGLSRELLELWCIDKKNGLIVPGYVIEGTMGKTILSEPDEIVSINGAKLPRKLSVHYISFSAHVDYTQNSHFIDLINPTHLILVHGDANEMGRLRSAFQSRYAEKEHPMQIYTPKNCETIELYFRGEKLAKVIGDMAKTLPKNNEKISGILVSKDFHYHIMDSKELSEFTDMTTTKIIQKQKISFHGTFSLAIFHLEQMFGEIKIIDEDTILVFNTVIVKSLGKSQLQIEWSSDATGDIVADSVLAVLLQIEGSPASVRMTESICLKKSKKNKIMKTKDDMEISKNNKMDTNIKEEIENNEIKMENIKMENIKMEDNILIPVKQETEVKEESEMNLSQSTEKVMVHNIMNNTHSSLEDDMEFELYMYKFLCMQFGMENVSAEHMSLPIILDYFGKQSESTSIVYDKDINKIIEKKNNDEIKKEIKEEISEKMEIDNENIKTEIKPELIKTELENEENNKENTITIEKKSELKETENIGGGKKIWKVCVDEHVCTIDRKTLDINSTNEDLRKRVLNVVLRVKKILRPIGETWNELINNTSMIYNSTKA